MVQYFWSFHLEEAKKKNFSETNFYYKTSLDNNVMHAAPGALPPKGNVLGRGFIVDFTVLILDT